MPTYDYECKGCQRRFEKYQPITATPIRKCPTCGQRKVVRLIGTGGGVIFRGSGFYHTDYRSDTYKKAAKAEAEKSGSKSESGSNDESTGKKDLTESTETSKKPNTPARKELLSD